MDRKKMDISRSKRFRIIIGALYYSEDGITWTDVSNADDLT